MASCCTGGLQLISTYCEVLLLRDNVEKECVAGAEVVRQAQVRLDGGLPLVTLMLVRGLHLQQPDHALSIHLTAPAALVARAAPMPPWD